MNDQQRAAMQMALEALHNTSNALLFVSADGYSVSKMAADAYDDAEKAITALREALAQPQDHSEQHLNMVQGEWVNLTDEEFETAIRKLRIDETMTLRDWNVGRAVIAKLKEKNTKPVVPQVVTEGNASEVRSTDTGEPVAWMRKPFGEDVQYCEKPFTTDWTPLYTTPPSVEAAIEATKEKAAKVCEELENPKDDLSAYSDGWIGGTFDCAAAIRRMK